MKGVIPEVLHEDLSQHRFEQQALAGEIIERPGRVDISSLRIPVEGPFHRSEFGLDGLVPFLFLLAGLIHPALINTPLGASIAGPLFDTREEVMQSF